MPAMWKATTPTVKVGAVASTMVWYGTTSQRAMHLAVPAPSWREESRRSR
jgi:hypothetical protein